MKDYDTMKDVKEDLTNMSSLAPLTAIPSSTSFQTTTRPNFTSETAIENKAVSMANTDCSSALSSPAEASPAKPDVTPTAFERTVQTHPATTHITSAPCLFSSTPFGSSDLEKDFPAVLTFKDVTVTLENNSVWKQFYSCGTEMILTKQGRRMFPYCRYRVAGLHPERLYTMVLSIGVSDKCRYRWSTSKWEVTGPAEQQAQGLIRAFSHHCSPCKGSEWMGALVSFYKLKLTNNSQDQEDHILLHSMHRYIPRLHVIPVPHEAVSTTGQTVVMVPESMTFTFPQTEFMAVTTYQNFRITQLKINHNPFAKGFREDGNNFRFNRLPVEAKPLETQSTVLKTNEHTERTEAVVDLRTKTHTDSASPSTLKETRLVLKPIMSFSASKDQPFVPCLRGKHALGELVLVQNRPLVEPKENKCSVAVTPELQQSFKVAPKAISSAVSTPRSSTGYRNFHKRRRRRRRRNINRRWANSRGREWKGAAASPSVVHSPSLTVAMQPELDDVEGLLFVSFTTKEALEIHIRDKPANNSLFSPGSTTTPVQLKEIVEVIKESEEEKIARLEANLLQELSVLKNRQVIHPVLQEVGLKLSSLDSSNSVDLQYLGVHLPLPPPDLPKQDNVTALSPGNSFISRTGKTNDMTKIKGWRNKFIKIKETSPNSDGLQKNLSAFCSNMLDEYLESEAQQISERAAAFSTNPEGSVAYQLPAKSSSYVKTLDSVLKRRQSVSKFPLGSNKPCPLSHKPLLYSALTSPPPPLASPVIPVRAKAQSTQQSPSSCVQSETASESGYISSVSQKATNLTGISQKPKVAFGQNQGMAHRPSGFTKFQFKLLQMEIRATNQGLKRTQLTADRLSVALSVILTKQTLPSQILKIVRYPKSTIVGPDCEQEFCRLGCVCSSLQYPKKGSLHCRRPECMFGCACFKRKITKQMSVRESEQEIQPVYSMTKMEHVVQPCRGSHAKKLWNRNIHDVDPEPLFIPKSSLLSRASSVSKVLKHSSTSHQTHPIREEDKDPVYKYLESMMTCARVREFNSIPPPVLSIEPKTVNISTANTITKVQKTTTDNLPKQYYRTVTARKKSGDNISQESATNETEARKQIQIQSACDWSKDRKMVLDALCRRVTKNKLSQRFYVGTYSIRPVAKIFIRKPSGSIVTYRIHISNQSNASDSEEVEFDDSDEEKHTNESFDRDIDSEKEEDGQIEEMQLGLTPFLSGVLPAGRLRARTKPLDSQAYGLIQVNGKSYNQARLMLGNMGSLHPANRLAAYITGRLNVPGKIFHTSSSKLDPTQKSTVLGSLHIKPAGTVVPPIITARKTTDLKTTTQPPVQVFQLDSGRKGSVNLPQQPQNLSSIKPEQSLVSSQRSSINPTQKSATTSPVSLTVSPSLKTPSFLGQSGTYSFRICPPTKPSTREQNLSGVTLPGGFTLIQLPKTETGGAAKQSENINMTNISGMDKPVPQKNPLFNLAQSATADSEAKNLPNNKPAEPRSFFELLCNEKLPSDESDEANSRQVKSKMDDASEDLSSNSSDYCGEGDEDEEMVDIETVEENEQGLAIAKLKEAVNKELQETRYSCDDAGSVMDPDLQDQMDSEQDQENEKRKNHVVSERQRRSEQRNLFDKLQAVLQSDPRAPRLRTLSLAVKEIRKLVETSKYLKKQKKKLTQMQSVYMKQLSLLSGKPEDLISGKLKEICERQKIKEKTMKWKPYFSHLLQSRAALLQVISPHESIEPPPLLQPDIFTTQQILPLLQSKLFRSPTQSSAPRDTPMPHSVPNAVSSPAHLTVGVSVAQSQVENRLGELLASFPFSQHQSKFTNQSHLPGAPAQIITSKPLTHEPTVPSTLQITAAPDAASSKSNPPCPAQPFTLPLIRSKTGRIILPSSLKPIGKGFYTLMVMKAKGKEEEDEVNTSANTQPYDVDLSTNQEKSISASDQPSDSESSRTLEEDKTTSSNFDPKSPQVPADLVSAPLQPLQYSVNSQEKGTVAGLNKPLPICLSFNRVLQANSTIIVKPVAAVNQRRRGRPRKNPGPPAGNSGNHIVVVDNKESASESQTPILVGEKQSEKMTLEVTQATKAAVTPVEVSEEADIPVPVKRGRGRPSKKSKLCSPSGGGTLSKSNEDSPVRLSSNFKNPTIKPKASPEATTLLGGIDMLRPLTRAALGKDFPSAKKRSWIDIEKELDPEFEYE